MTESIRFGPFELDVGCGELRRNGDLIPLRQQAVKILSLLATRPGRLVTREEIRSEVWGTDTVVDFDQGLNDCVRGIRAALQDRAKDPMFVETLPRRGYRFIAPTRGATPVGPSSRGSVDRGRRRRALRVTLGFVVVAVIASFAFRRPTVLGDLFEERSVRLVVLPFEDLSGDEAHSYFSDGLTDEMIAGLGRLDPQRLAVLSRSTASVYGESDLGIGRIGRELAVDYVLEGSVRREDGRARITVKLIDVESESQVWAETYARDLRHILEVQSEVARAVASGVRLALSPEAEARLAGAHPVDPEAYRQFLRGRHLADRLDISSLRKSLHYFERAIAEQPDYAAAYVGLADSYLSLGEYTALPTEEVLLRSRAAVARALELDPNLSSAHKTLAWIQSNYELDWEAAEASYRRAIALNPSDAKAHQWFTHLLRATGRVDEAINEAHLALDLDPVCAIYGTALGFALNDRGDHGAASAEFDRVLEMHPGFPPAQLGRGYVLLALGEGESAIESMEAAARSVGGSALFDATLGYTYATSGHERQAREVLDAMVAAPVRSPFLIALVHVGLGEHDEAIQWLEMALDKRDPRSRTLAVDARFAPLRTDPRYADLIVRFRFATEPPATASD
jgi:TolB-like protein/DNA-binding winged helix-turn-helix (wHTH) protein/Tfp pilus assembly protein PilF